MHTLIPQKITPVIEAVRTAGGRPFVVGGAVRDALLGLAVPTKDLDFEVYHLSLEALVAQLSRFGRTDVVGRSFGVIKLWMKGVGEIDFSLPRRESKSGAGHRGFIVAPDPDMPPEEACARRDFTLNAVLMDPFDGATFDYYNGINDLENRLLRHTSHHFAEDPLRPLRAVQLAARFNFDIHDETAELCASMADEARFLAKERIFGEWSKWVSQGAFPGAGLRVLRRIGWSAVFPEVTALIEGDDDIARIERRVRRVRVNAAAAGVPPEDLEVLVLTALCRSMSAASLDSFLERIGAPPKLARRVTVLSNEARQFDAHPPHTDEAVLRTAVRLACETVAGLALVLKGDAETELGAERLLENATRLGVHKRPPACLLTGRDLTALGVLPGPGMGDLLRAAFDAQLKGVFTTRQEAAAWICRHLEKQQ